MAGEAAPTADPGPSDRPQHAPSTPRHLNCVQPRCELASSLAAYSTMYRLILTSPATGVTPPLSSVRT